MPVLPFPEHAHAAAHKVEICLSTTGDLGPPQPCPLHEQDRWPLVRQRRLPDTREFVEARAIDVGLALRWPAGLPRWIEFDDVLSLSPAEERVEDGDDVRPGGRAPSSQCFETKARRSAVVSSSSRVSGYSVASFQRMRR
jgi:hypothetical protein